MKSQSMSLVLLAPSMFCVACGAEPPDQDGASSAAVGAGNEALTIREAGPEHTVASYHEGSVAYGLETQMDADGEEWIIRDGDQRELVRLRMDEKLYDVSFLEGALIARGQLGEELSEVNGDPEVAVKRVRRAAWPRATPVPWTASPEAP